MAKRKPTKPGPKPDPDRAKSAQFTVRVQKDFKAWAEGFARSRGVDLPEMVRVALVRHAAEVGYPGPDVP